MAGPGTGQGSKDRDPMQVESSGKGQVLNEGGRFGQGIYMVNISGANS